MQVRKTAITLLLLAAIFTAPDAAAQSSSINSFSPYTIYGLGDIAIQGPVQLRAMGATGTAYRDVSIVNSLNPASYSMVPRKSFIFNLDMEGGGFYLRETVKKSSYNTFNVTNVSVLFPLYKGLGLGISVSPYSQVGYRISREDEDPLLIGEIGRVVYKYEGSGNVTEAKIGIGWQVFKNFSIGANLIYYKGRLDRTVKTAITAVTGIGNYYNTNIYRSESISRLAYDVGIQYDPISTDKSKLTIGATFMPKRDLDPTITNAALQDYVVATDTIPMGGFKGGYTLPNTIAAGVFYHTQKVSVGIDYRFRQWEGINSGYTNVRYRNTNTMSVGVQYNPNRYDARNFLKRWSYRIGVRYGDYYMSYNGHNITEKAVTAGFGIPINTAGLTNINIGLEYGTRGTTKYGLIKENYFKFSIGLSLFGTDDWFRKYRYN
jgi:hypothetical protein